MGGEEKNRSKRSRPEGTMIGLDSRSSDDDDELIVSLFNSKRGGGSSGSSSSRNAKKVKKVETKACRVGEDEGFGGLDDTLASLRKKLKKGPKKESASVDARVTLGRCGSGGEGVVGGVSVGGGVEIEGKGGVEKAKVAVKNVQNVGDGVICDRNRTLEDGLEDRDGRMVDGISLDSSEVEKVVKIRKLENGYCRGADRVKEECGTKMEHCMTLEVEGAMLRSDDDKPSSVSPTSLSHRGGIQNEQNLDTCVMNNEEEPRINPFSPLKVSAENHAASGKQVEETCGGPECLKNHKVETVAAPVSPQKETALISVDRLSLTTANSNEECRSASPTSMTPEGGDDYQDAVSVPDSDVKEGRISALQRLRNAKKPRFEDMAYEGDADWEILTDEKSFLDGDQAFDNDKSFRTKEKFVSSTISGSESGGAAAVSAGLRACAVGPVEKIKFKDILKRKGGLQEYLECRNHILGLWNKDVCHILSLDDCGRKNAPSEDESLHASLVREVYTFLDQGGYINVGIASEKGKVVNSTKHSSEILEGKPLEEKIGASTTNLEDTISFGVGQVKNSGTSLDPNNNIEVIDENLASKETQCREIFSPMALEASRMMGFEESPVNNVSQEIGVLDTDLPLGRVTMDKDLTADPSFEILKSSTLPLKASEMRNDMQIIQSFPNDDLARDHVLQFDSDSRKKVIVIGAGPAGLTAARHLQRQGFSVTVLEARSRIGGRVYTDRSSFSVPVDLGASIITGVEADVATERRPDPSSLICAQLGLELTVLNSDCPLYDIVTGEKVPSDLDEALEAEFNGLLDDMLFLVAQKGEHATKMSLEDGLEYALNRRRVVQSGMVDDETELQTSADVADDFETCRVKGGNHQGSSKEVLNPLERRVMDWHFANLEYGCAASLNKVSLPYWNQDDVYGGFGGAHCMIKEGYSNVVESIGKGLDICLDHVVTKISYASNDNLESENPGKKVRVSTSNGTDFIGDAVLITVPLGCLKAETISFSPPLPHWKSSAIQRLGFGVLNKVVLEFPRVFWDDSVDYFGATAEETDCRGRCFMFWNVRKTVGAPVLIALVVGKAALDGQAMSTSDHVCYAMVILRKLFGENSVPDPVASTVTDWGRDPFARGAYSYVAIGSSGQDYDILGRPVENCLFFAGEATCKEHPDTVGGAMMSGLREAVCIINRLTTGNDYTAEIEMMEAVQKHSDSERDEVRDITERLEAFELSNALSRKTLNQARILTREALLQDMFFITKTTAGRLYLAKKLLNLPVDILKSFAGTKKGLTMLNSWILDSMGKDGTQLLRHCVRLLVLVSTDLLAVRLSGIGKTVKEKVCVHTSRDIRAIASQLVSVWLEVFRRQKASNRGRLWRQAADPSKRKSSSNQSSLEPPFHNHHTGLENKSSLEGSTSAGSHSNANLKKANGRLNAEVEGDYKVAMSAEEQAAVAAAEAAQAAARAAAEAYATETQFNKLQLPKILSFNRFARREQYAQMDEIEYRSKWSSGVVGRQDCLSEIDSRNCRVRDWPVDFSAACANLDNPRLSVDNISQRSQSNEIACNMNFKEQSGESAAVDSSLYTKAWVDSAGSEGIKDYHAIERWQSQAAAANSGFFPSLPFNDEGDSNMSSRPHSLKKDARVDESSVSQVIINKDRHRHHHRGADHIKQAVVDFVASLLMPVYKARKIDREGYKSIMKKTATKVMEQATDAEKAMAVPNFLDFKRKNKIRAFVDTLIERHMATHREMKP